MSNAADIAGLAASTGPRQDKAGRPIPPGISAILGIVAILIAYGRHLNETLERRAAMPGFATIAQFFGTATVAVIAAQLRRGIMRAVALERMLLMRAALGIDLRVLAPRARPCPRPPAHPPAGPPAAPAPRPDPSVLLTEQTGGAARDLPLSMRQIEAQVRRRPVGQTIVDICRDLGVSPALCAGPFWNRIFDAIRWYRGSFGNVVLEMRRREKRLDRELWKHPGLGLPETTRAGIRRVVGCFIGETPDDPVEAGVAASPAATATGPP